MARGREGRGQMGCIPTHLRIVKLGSSSSNSPWALPGRVLVGGDDGRSGEAGAAALEAEAEGAVVAGAGEEEGEEGSCCAGGGASNGGGKQQQRNMVVLLMGCGNML